MNRHKLTLFFTLTFFPASHILADDCTTLFEVQDYGMALTQCKQESRHASVQAQFILGQIFEQGLGVEKNIPKAISYYRQAVLNNDVDAQIALGKYHAKDKRYLQSHVFFSLADDNGSMRAQAYKTKAEQNLTTHELVLSNDFIDIVKSAIAEQRQQVVMQ